MWTNEVQTKQRFNFGKNWLSYNKSFNEDRCSEASLHLLNFLKLENLNNLTFLDVGCGSGLMSLCAYEAGANVISIDYDPNSVLATSQMRENRGETLDHERWKVFEGSCLDGDMLKQFCDADIIYCWGVAHHTGDMNRALENLFAISKPGTIVYFALYNDQGWISKYWLIAKKVYNSSFTGRLVVSSIHFFDQFLLRLITGVFRKKRTRNRGMDLWHDMHDWLGGLPFEVAKVSTIEGKINDAGFQLMNLNTVGNRHGCNEFLIKKLDV